MGLKRLGLNILALRPTAQGFTGSEARQWIRKVHRHRWKDFGFSRAETKWAINHGFMPEQVKALGITEENYRDYISAKDYAYLKPLNGTYRKWISDKITVHTIFKPFRKNMPEIYYQIGKRFDTPHIISLSENVKNESFQGLINLIKDKTQVSVEVASGFSETTIQYLDGKFYSNEVEITENEIIKAVSNYESTIIVKEKVIPKNSLDNGVINLIVFNEFGDNPVIGDGFITFEGYQETTLTGFLDDDADNLEEKDEPIDKILQNESTEAIDVEKGLWGDREIPFWDEITDTIKKLCVFVPQLEFFGAQIVITESGFYITRLSNHPKYPTCKPFSKETSAYLMRKVEQKKEAYRDKKLRVQRGIKKIKLKVRAGFSKLFFPEGLKPYLSLRWISDVFKDFIKCKDTSFKEKMWAYNHGFLSYRLVQYGINEKNYHEFISDFEYKWLRHINTKYRKWMEDKITVKYICSDFNRCFPEYYFHIICKNGNNKVISMMDLPEDYTNNFEEIFRLVEEKGVLALKPDEGSHGDGFYKFTYENGKYQLNYEDVSKADVLNILEDVKNQYLVTEYIDMCDELKAVYDGAVNTVRMIVFKKDGRTPEIGNAYIRFGSKKTGAVDNVGAGGMTATIDVETGYFHDAKIVMDNSIEDCPIHPDTGVPIDGYLPHWDKVKEDVLKVTASIKQLEWFGVDLAVTKEGIKFPEINRFPDFPAVEKYTKGTREYLLDRLLSKKRVFGFHKKPNRTLVHLPKREK